MVRYHDGVVLSTDATLNELTASGIGIVAGVYRALALTPDTSSHHDYQATAPLNQPRDLPTLKSSGTGTERAGSTG